MLVTRTRYNAKGEPFETVDPKGVVTRTEFDALGRRVRTIQNYLPGSTAPDANITTEFTYKAGHLTAVTAVNAATGNQTTRYEYGVSPATGSLVSRNDLLREIIYPDGGLNTVKLRYNRQGERIGMTDQNGTVHAYERDKLGRMSADEVTSLGTGIDGAVRKLGTTYNARGLVEKLTSYGPTGSVVNEVKNTYNGLNQLTEQAQSHAGAVTGGTPKVEYGYDHSASGGVFTKGARPTDVTYPSGRVIDFDYGSAGGAGDKLARIEALVDGAQTLVAYSYLGVGTFVVTDYIEPELKLDYTAAASGDAKYPGFDQYNRVVQHHWTAYGASPGLRDGFDYGYDANSNRLWRANLTAQALDKPFDELYQYDSLNRLVDFQRGTLNVEHTAILGTPTKEQTWNLDPTGNWSQFTSADDGTLETDQTRISNPANEITEISSWFPPGYDHAGNMTRIPQPANPQEGYIATWDAWNRMVKLIDAGTSNTVQENAFDAQTWRTVRNDYEAGSLSETLHFFYTAQWQSIEERLGAATTPERQHVWGLRYIDDLVLRDRDTDDDGDLDERLYAMQDANWNVTGIVDVVGSVQERYVYEAYGFPSQVNADYSLVATIDAIASFTHLFTGQHFDPTCTLYFYRRRWLESWLGRFLSREPSDLTFGDNNAYSYVASRPTQFTDPSGQAPECISTLVASWAWSPVTNNYHTCIELDRFQERTFEECVPRTIYERRQYYSNGLYYEVDVPITVYERHLVTRRVGDLASIELLAANFRERFRVGSGPVGTVTDLLEGLSAPAQIVEAASWGIFATQDWPCYSIEHNNVAQTFRIVPPIGKSECELRDCLVSEGIGVAQSATRNRSQYYIIPARDARTCNSVSWEIIARCGATVANSATGAVPGESMLGWGRPFSDQRP